MNKQVKLIRFSLIVLVSIILFTQASVAAFKNVSVGSTAPNIELKDIDGNLVSLEKIYNEKEIVILTFWASWSPRAVKEMSDLQKIYSELSEKGIEVIAVNVDDEDISGEDIDKIKAVISESGAKYNVLLDQGLSTFYDYGVVAIPSTAIIKKGGEIIKDYAGYATFAFNDIKDNVEIALGIKEPPKDVVVADEKKYKPIKASLLHYGLGKKLIQRGMPDKAIREFKKAVELDEKFDLPHSSLAEVYYNKAQALIQKKKSSKAEGLLKDAREEYVKAIEINPESLPALSGLALVLMDEKKDAEAEENINKVLALESNYTPALSARGILYKNRGDVDKAIESFDAALELNPNQPDIHYLKAVAYKEAGINEKAIVSLKDAFKFLMKSVSLAMVQEDESEKKTEITH